MSRAQCIVHRGTQILMVLHRQGGEEWWCLPGRGIEQGEDPDVAAVRELREECRVEGRLLKLTSMVGYGNDDCHYTYLVDIGEQIPSLGDDPEKEEGKKILVDVAWMSFNELSERDRAYLWTVGLLTVEPFATEMLTWGRQPNTPKKEEAEPCQPVNHANILPASPHLRSQDMKWRMATPDDVQMLGEMNLRLIQDEKHRNPMEVTQLVQRMRDFLAGDYKAVIFEDHTEVVGYALFHPQEDFLYLRQFFIERHRRREGNGRAAMRLLMNNVFPTEQRLVVTVLSTNPDALNFWKAVGFADYCTSLEILPRRSAEPSTLESTPHRQIPG